MKFTEEQLNRFIKLYKQEFCEEIDQAEALRQATALVSLVKLTYEPMSKKDFKFYSSLK
jgi:hypothetical protein